MDLSTATSGVADWVGIGHGGRVRMPVPETIEAIGNEIAIRWSDGSEDYFPMEVLRAASPSAENRGEKDLLGRLHGGSRQTEFPGVTVTGWNAVGGYAVQFLFSDGHSTGIYGFDYLAELGRRLREKQS